MDFKQKSLVTTLHDFGRELNWQKEELESSNRTCSLILPMLYSELKKPALKNIVQHLNSCGYLDQVVISLKANGSDEYVNTVKFFKKLKVPHIILWNGSKNVARILESLNREDINILNLEGKGRDMWLALGVASLDTFAIALTDADVVTFTDEMPTRLLFPIVSPNLGFFFNKSYYTRIEFNELQMYGRVFRLFVTPLIDSLKRKIKQRSPFLEYLDSFKYALSGEFALTSDLALNTRVPGDWGVEISILTEVFRNASLKRICQTDLGFHDHKHRRIGDRKTGLVKMAGDIEKSLLRALVEMEGVDVSTAFLQSLQVLYRRLGQDYIHSYGSDSFFNGLVYDRNKEEKVLDVFSDIILSAGQEYLKKPFGMLIPSWARINSALPNLRHDMKEAAEKDMETLRV